MCELPTSRPERRRRATGRVSARILILLGVGFLAGPCLARFFFARAHEDKPGRLVALDSALTWRSPSEGQQLTLANSTARARFQVKNVGDRPVEIVATESSCGCAVPSVVPRTIAPGAIGTVDVTAAPLAVGERTVTFALRTDSVVTPTVGLRLHVVGSREPPFVSAASGDVTFDDETVFGEAREFFVNTVEWKSAKPSPPAASGGFPGLTVGPGRLYSEKPSFSPNAISRIYLYEARLEKPYPSRRLTGEIKIDDPWHPTQVFAILARAELRPTLRVVPSTVTIHRTTGVDRPSTTVLVTSQSGIHNLVFRSGADCPIEVATPSPVGSSNQMAMARLSLKPGARVAGRYDFEVGDPNLSQWVGFSVLVREEGSQ